MKFPQLSSVKLIDRQPRTWVLSCHWQEAEQIVKFFNDCTGSAHTFDFVIPFTDESVRAGFADDEITQMKGKDLIFRIEERL